ncbi:MAG TPA: hypothetical protein DCR39_02430 [Nitrospiraceae bacterium]|nr:hypothetical protein [Nitrospiraceae bacterium]
MCHPHLHCLVTNGAFSQDGTFHAMEILFSLRSLALLALSEAKKALPGFHIHNEGKVVAKGSVSSIVY